MSAGGGRRSLHEEGVQRMLEGSNRTVGIGKGGLEMCEDLRPRPVLRLSRQPGWQLGRRAASRQGRADFALALVEALPDALHGSVTKMTVGGADGCGHAAGGGALEEPPQAAGGQAEPSDLVRTPDAEGPPAPATCMAVAAKNPPRPQRFSPGALVKSVQIAVADQHADNLAVRTRHLFEPLSNEVPFAFTVYKPLLVAHLNHTSTKT
jgi:hypothetical protein